MEKKIILLVSLGLITSFMVGCAVTPSSSSASSSSKPSSSESSSSTSSSSTSTEEVGNKISFVDAGSLVASLEKSEYNLSNGATIINETKSNGYTVTKNENLKIYEDSSSSSSGTLKRTSPMGRVLAEDTFVGRKKRQIDRFNVDNKEVSFNMYYSVYDYENENVSSYKDSAGAVYIVNTASDAYAGGLTDGQFILESEYNKYTSLQVCLQVETALDDLFNDDYVLAKGITDIYYKNLDNGNINYFLTVEYNYDGDLNDVYTVNKELSFEVNADKTKLLNVTYNVTTTDTNKSDPTDTYVSANNYSATLSYETREKVDEDSLIDVNSYFLEDVSEVNILTYNSKGDKEVVSDYSNIDVDGKYIFLEAKTYTPSKAVNISLTNKSSSNEAVVKKESSGHFTLVGPGKTTLTATYSGKDEYGVYVEKEISVDIVVTQKEVSAFSIDTESCNIYKNDVDESGNVKKGEFLGRFGAHDNTLFINNNYSFTIKQNASKATEYSVTSSDETKAKASLDGNTLTVYALAKGEVNITVSLKDDPSVYNVYHFYILDNDDVSSLVKGKTFYLDTYKTVYYYTGEISFDSTSSTGTLTITNYDSKTLEVTKTTVTNFSYSIIDGYLLLDEGDYSFASPNSDGTSLFLEDPGNYVTREYKVKA